MRKLPDGRVTFRDVSYELEELQQDFERLTFALVNDDFFSHEEREICERELAVTEIRIRALGVPFPTAGQG